MDPDHPIASIGAVSNAEILVADAIDGKEGSSDRIFVLKIR